MKILTNKTKEDFKKYQKWYYSFLSKHIQILIIYRWFNLHTNICIDIQHWQDDGFDFSVQHPNKNKVYLSINSAGNRTKDFDRNLAQAIIKADEIYNSLN